MSPALKRHINNSRAFVEEVNEQWKQFTMYVFSMKKMYDYLDRYYLKNGGQHVQSLTETALKIWKASIFDHQQIELRRSILEEIKKDRMGEMTDLEVIKTSIQQYIYMGYEKRINVIKDPHGNFEWKAEKNLLIYDREFEKYLLNTTTEFFKERAHYWFSTLACNEYVVKIQQHLQKEESNADYFL